MKLICNGALHTTLNRRQPEHATASTHTRTYAQMCCSTDNFSFIEENETEKKNELEKPYEIKCHLYAISVYFYSILYFYIVGIAKLHDIPYRRQSTENINIYMYECCVCVCAEPLMLLNSLFFLPWNEHEPCLKIHSQFFSLLLRFMNRDSNMTMGQWI